MSGLKFVCHLNSIINYFTSRGSPQSLPQQQPVRVVETEFCVLFIAGWQFVVAHHLQLDREVVCTSRCEYQSVNYKIKRKIELKKPGPFYLIKKRLFPHFFSNECFQDDRVVWTTGFEDKVLEA